MISTIFRIHLVCLFFTFHISDIFGKSLEITAETNSDSKVEDATKIRKKREITSKCVLYIFTYILIIMLFAIYIVLPLKFIFCRFKMVLY